VNITEKILAKASGKTSVSPGEIVDANVDMVMVHDLTGPLAVEAFKRIGVEKVWDNKKAVVILDHQVPAESVKAAELHKMMRQFAEQQGIRIYDVGKGGICHQVMPEKGHVLPGTVIVGADSHTCTYGAFGAFATGIGSTEAAAVFATGKIWLKVPSAIKVNVNGKFKKYTAPKDLILHVIGELSDPDAAYEKTVNIDVTDLGSQVACPAQVDNVKPASELSSVPLDQAFIGSCTNGRIEDLRVAAEILKGKQVKDGVRTLVIPASQEVYRQALNEGLMEIFTDAGALVCGSTCGPCLGGHIGLLAPGETCVSTSNRNFIGRMGSPEANVYLASPATVAASALTGHITDPNKLEAHKA
jgi:3-isopropylmalate/(R)-2-methylmalate dehydratase large subunit